MSFRITPVTQASQLLGTKIAADVFDAPIDEARLRAYLGDDKHYMVIAIDQDLVVGQARAIVHLHPDEPDELYIDNLGVSPSHQRRGIARKLMQALFDWGKERGCIELWLGTEADNDSGNGFYRALELDETPMIMYSDDLDEW
ncbi:MAG: GNAT family N-acetyltransferase [Alphaproteobacteria bacterium]